MVTVTIELPPFTTIAFEKGDAGSVKIDWALMAKHPACIVDLLAGGANIILKNAYNSGGKDEKLDKGGRLAKAQKRLDGWHAGQYVSVERGESQYTAMREQFIAEQAPDYTTRQVDAAIRDQVTRVFGRDESATFARYLHAVAVEKYNAMKAQDADSVADLTIEGLREDIETGLAERTRKAAEDRAARASKLDVKGIVLKI